MVAVAMIETVFLVWHSHRTGANELNEKLIGVYLTDEHAKTAVKRASRLNGFMDYPEGFEICKYVVGEDGWKEGYFTT